MNTALNVGLRIFAALANVAPPLVGSYALGRVGYGAAATLVAVALVVTGPANLVLSQGLLRTLVSDGPGEKPVACALMFCAACFVLIYACYGGALLSGSEALHLSCILGTLIVLRICEVALISESRVAVSVLTYYALPPLLSCLFFLAFAQLGAGYEWAAAAQCSGYVLAMAAALVAAKRIAVPLLWKAAHQSPGLILEELRRSVPLGISGALVAAAEHLPLVLLRSLGAFAVVPVFELARKIASIPSTLANPLLNQSNPAVIRAYKTQNHDEMTHLLHRLFRLLRYFSIVYLLGVSAFVAVSFYWPQLLEISYLLVPLAIGSLFTTWSLPYGSVLMAAHEDRWLAFSSGTAACVLLLLTPILLGLHTPPAIAVAVAAATSVVVSNILVRVRALGRLDAIRSGSLPRRHEA
ncbi:hypothetical protein [Polaromonas sp. CG9_12]|nr:hypothetical protein [Polaromonas sp. CG9_12]